MVSSTFYNHISLRFWVYFAFGVSENTMTYVDIVRMISSIPSLTARPEVTLRRWTPRLLFRRSWT
jgi:hypothetical protein